MIEDAEDAPSMGTYNKMRYPGKNNGQISGSKVHDLPMKASRYTVCGGTMSISVKKLGAD